MTSELSWALRLTRDQTLAMVHDVDEVRWWAQSCEGEQHPAWILGHLVLADSYLLHLLGAEALPLDFNDLVEAYGPDSRPSTTIAANSLSHRPVADRLARLGGRRCEAISKLTPTSLLQPLPDSALVTSQPTVGHHLLSLIFHEGHHGGQLAAWRRHQELPMVPWTFAPRAPSE